MGVYSYINTITQDPLDYVQNKEIDCHSNLKTGKYAVQILSQFNRNCLTLAIHVNNSRDTRATFFLINAPL